MIHTEYLYLFLLFLHTFILFLLALLTTTPFKEVELVFEIKVETFLEVSQFI